MNRVQECIEIQSLLCNDDKSVHVLNRALFDAFHERTMLVNERYHLPWNIYYENTVSQ